MIAYLIIAHKNLHQVVRLVDCLAGPRSRFFVHIDARSELTPALRATAERDDVDLVERFACPWGEFGIVEATLAAMAAAIRSTPPVSRLTLLSGQDYPIKPRQRIETLLLDERPDASFIEHFPLPRPGFDASDGMARSQNWYFHLAGKYRSLHNARVGLRRSPPAGLRLFVGGQYWSMARRCAEYVLDSAERKPRVRRFFRHTLLPDESFFQSIVMSSPLAPTIVNSDLRYEDWSAAGAHPAIITLEHLPRLAASEALFAKKFDTAVDRRVLDAIDDKLLGRSAAGGSAGELAIDQRKPPS